MEWKIVGDKLEIQIINLNINKRPVSAVADNYELEMPDQFTLKAIKNSI